jgi:hypothetical protein
MTAVLAIDYPSALDDRDSDGVSPEAGSIRRLFDQTRESLWRSVSFGAVREECRNRLFDMWAEAGSPGWDGYDAQPVQAAALSKALSFIDALPSDIPAPEISADPDGEVSFDWCGDRKRHFSISIGENNVMSYAGLFGSDRAKGSERFDGSIPRVLISYAKRATE